MSAEAGSLNPNDWLFLGNSLYSVGCIGTTGDVTVVHQCPDGRQQLVDLDRHDEIEPAGERLVDLRGRLDDLNRDISAATVRINRQGANQINREAAAGQRRRWRAERSCVQAQIAELEDLGIVAELHPGPEPRHHEELRAEQTI